MDSPTVPAAPVQIPNYTNYQPDQEAFRLRKRLTDLLRLGAATPETFQQTLMQLWNENERRRQSCMQEAEDHLRKYHQLVAQAHAFSAQSSIAFNVINGYVIIEERRIQEEAERAKERAEVEAEARKLESNGHTVREAQEAALEPEITEEKPSGGRRKKP